jgi:hypothetical protein
MSNRGFFAAILLFMSVAASAMAETPSMTCLQAVKAANAHRKPEAIPTDCWRMGPLHLSMTPAQAKMVLGTPGASETLTVNYRRRKYPLTRLYYAFPRNLKNWLRLAPAQVKDFHPITIRLDFFKDALVAISVDDTMRLDRPACIPSAPGHAFVHRASDFPYGFHGLTLGGKIDDVAARFGKFAATAPGRDLRNYWPVPLSVSGTAKVEGIRIATGMAFASGGGIADYRLTLDPRSCFITGYDLKPGIETRH